DGRAILLGEVTGRDGQRYDIQLKGSGRTPFSRGGDGRAVLGPVLREYIVSEAMAALRIPTTRALAAVVTGEVVQREVPSPGAVFTRVASSHLRVGTFQFFAARGDTAALRQLAEYAMARHYPEASTAAKPFRAFLEGVIGRQARLVAQWMSIGFIHGVMNTDNTSISGETIDYGPCAFMEAYDPETVFSSIDRMGRYAYGSQPGAMAWNLMRLAESLLPLLEAEEGGQEAAVNGANEALSTFGAVFEAAYEAAFRRKIGLEEEHEGDRALIYDLLERMTANGVDFTQFFRGLCDVAETGGAHPLRKTQDDQAALEGWMARWRERVGREKGSNASERAGRMREVNPVYIPRNHRVEEALRAATESQNFEPFERLLEVLAKPYEGRPGLERYALPALPEERVRQTFCGT
ncbi:MAG: YdiU family protein, partial [Rhodospirillales bacterium]|nr:YdiU family protein [Acetobacter sp.]